MIFKKIVLSVCLFLCVGVQANADARFIQTRKYTSEQGLSNSTITAIAQDKNGFMWIGTSNGLNRFDGYRFKTYKNDPLVKNSLCANQVKCLYVDSGNCIWIGSLDGMVSKFNTKTETFTTYKCSFPMEMNKGDVSAFAEDSDGTIWITVDRMGVVSLNPKTGDMKRYRTQDGTTNALNHNALTGMSIDKDDNLWMTTWGGGLNYYNKHTGKFKHYFTECVNGRGTCSHMTSVFHDSHNICWIATTHAGAFAFDKDMNMVYHFSTRDKQRLLASETVQSFAEDNAGNIWIGTAGGVDIFSPKNNTTYHVMTTDGLLASAMVNDIIKDRDGTIWIGTDIGLYIYAEKSNFFNFVHTSSKTAQLGNVIAILKDRTDRTWLRDKDRCVRISAPDINGNTEVTDLNKDIAGMSVQCFYEDSNGNIWIGYYNDIVTCYNPFTNKYTHIKLNGDSDNNEVSKTKGLLPMRTVNAFYEDYDGQIWIALEVGLARLNPKTGNITSIIRCHKLIYPDEKVQCILRDSQGILWAGTQGGLRCYDKDMKLRKIYTPKEGDDTSLSSQDITAIHESKDGTLWVGTTGGLHKYDREKDCFVAIRRPSARFGDPALAVFEDSRGHIWYSSSVGIIEYNSEKNIFHIYDKDDGLQGGEFNKGVGWQTRDGEILFGGHKGANIFNPLSINMSSDKHKVVIEDFMIFNKSILPGDDSPLKTSIIDTKKITLDYDQSTISFNFACLDYSSPQKLQYAYKMDKVDNDWIYTTSDNRTANYANLAPGVYEFSVMATDTDGDWDGEITTIQIVINPPLWKTWWAYLIYIILFCTSIYGVIKYYTNKAKENANLEMERMVAKQQHEMDELKLQIFANISHEFRTSLTLILSPLEFILNQHNTKEDTQQILQIMHRNALRLMRLINQLLDFRKNESGQLVLHSTNQDIVSFVSETYYTFLFDAKQRGIDFVFKKEIERKMMDFDKDKLDKIIYNLLSNAMKYTDAGGHVELAISAQEVHEHEYVNIRITDDGIGIAEEDKENIFKLFYQSGAQDGKYRGGSGLGLNMTREMVRLHGGDISVVSTPGEGSCFTVTLPVRNGTAEATTIAEQPVIVNNTLNIDTTEKKANKRTKEIILVVEDNADMREYITQLLSGGYEIITAEDGAEGLEKAAEHMPDLIISDLMMPKMDGLEMLHHLKEDGRIGHIPVVMLTAVSDEDTVVESLQTGVDEYVTKPFSAAVLKARIKNILGRRTQRRQVKEYKETYISPFIQQMKELIQKNMSNPDLTVDWLADEMKMSASQLTRKTKTLCDTTPYRIVIQTRMEEAVTLIKNTDLNATEIAYKCGYQEISNFSRAFTAYFKISPATYIKRIRSGKDS